MKMKLKLLGFCFFAFMTSLSAQLNKGLIVHTSFDTDGKDSGPNHFAATLNGAVISTESVVGKGAVYLNGVDNYVSFPENKVYFNGSYSISIWCKMQSGKTWSRILDFNQDKPSTGNSVTWLIGRPGQTQNNMWFDQWVFYEGKAVESITDITQSNPPNASLNYSIILDEWAHFVITYDSKAKNNLGIQVNRKGEKVPLEGLVTLYVNGKKISSNEYCLKPQDKPTIANWLGRSRFAPDPYYKGFMDDFRIYNRVLSDEEIRKLYQMKNR
jgi:hypothetical protein